MTQEKESKILKLIRALMDKTVENGATQEEMEAALTKAQELMRKHQIEQDDIFVSANDIDETVVENRYQGYEGKYWLWELLRVIGSSYQCRVIRYSKYDLSHRGKYEKVAVYRIIGTEEDRAVVKTLFERVVPMIRELSKSRWKQYLSETKEWERSNNAMFTRSYITGFMAGLSEKLNEERSQYFQENPQHREKWGLIHVRKTDLVDSYVAEKIKPKDVKTKSTTGDHRALKMGFDDGQEKNAHKQLN